jgi:hypothetical protein
MKLNKGNTQPPMLGNRQISRLIFEDSLTVGVMTSIDMQRAVNYIKEFCDKWELKMNLAKTKRVLIKNGRMLSKNEKWNIVGEEID